jgi:hypothetical protein
MKHLAGLLKDRTASYDRADLTVDTSTTSIEHCLQQITTFLNDRQHADH